MGLTYHAFPGLLRFSIAVIAGFALTVDQIYNTLENVLNSIAPGVSVLIY